MSLGKKPKNCKCIDCMKLFCSDHLHNHREYCKKVCRFCKTEKDIKEFVSYSVSLDATDKQALLNQNIE